MNNYKHFDIVGKKIRKTKDGLLWRKYYDYIIYSNGTYYSLKSNRWLKVELNKHSNKKYYYFQFCYNGKRFIKEVHRLLAELFISNPKNLPFVNHIDQNKFNNSLDNLEWCSAEYNSKEFARFYKNDETLKNWWKNNKKSYGYKILDKETGIIYNSKTNFFKEKYNKKFSQGSFNKIVKMGKCEILEFPKRWLKVLN